MTADQSLGRKIFFLHPSAIILNQIFFELAQDEYEVYTAKDEKKLRNLLKKYPDSIVFANINDGIKESEWEEWIRSVMGSDETRGVDVGVLSYGGDETLRKKYAEYFKVSGGFIAIKSDTSVALRQMLTVLNNLNAKGRRKYIRALTDKETNVTVNLPINGTFVNGLIKDISVVGFSCAFADDPALAKNTLFDDIQIRLQSQLIKAEAIVFGSRMDGDQKNYVFLFTQRVNPATRAKIRKYIQSYLQSKIDEELK